MMDSRWCAGQEEESGRKAEPWMRTARTEAMYMAEFDR